MLLDEIGQVDKVFPSLFRSCGAPFAIECLTGGGYRNIYILFGSFVNGYDRLFVGWIDGLERLAIDALDPLVVDEARNTRSALCSKAMNSRLAAGILTVQLVVHISLHEEIRSVPLAT